jgi:hypothetical protein
VNTLVIDASMAVKWVVDEDGTPEALALRQRAKLTTHAKIATNFCAAAAFPSSSTTTPGRNLAHGLAIAARVSCLPI